MGTPDTRTPNDTALSTAPHQMAFTFNFGAEEVNETAQLADEPAAQVELTQAYLVPIDQAAQNVQFSERIFGNTNVTVALYSGIVSTEQSGALAETTTDSDLVPHVYEGGFKLWECAIDLCEYMLAKDLGRPGLLDGKRVMELGCGHGLPGILAAQAGASVDFCDFNHEVLSGLTIPNTIRNCDSQALAKCRFFAGDWNTLPEVVGTRYDLILTSDTLYSVEALENLSQLLPKLLAPEGMALVAAKTYYFGVGGGTDMFKDAIRNKTSLEVADDVESYQDGMTNVREILKVTSPRATKAAKVCE